MPELAQGLHHPRHPLPHRLHQPHGVARRIRREKEQRQREHRQPQARHRPRDAAVLEQRLVEPEKRRVRNKPPGHIARQGEEHQHEDEDQQPAEIAQRQPQPGQKPDARMRRDRRQHGVVKHRREFIRHRDDDDRRGHSRNADAPVIRQREPQHHHRRHHQQRERADPRLAAAAEISDSPQKRCQQRNRHPGKAIDIAPDRLPLDRVTHHLVGEIGRKHIDRDQQHIGVAGPFKQRPGNLPAPVRRRAAIGRHIVRTRLIHTGRCGRGDR